MRCCFFQRANCELGLSCLHLTGEWFSPNHLTVICSSQLAVMDRQWEMQTIHGYTVYRKSFGTVKRDHFIQVVIMDRFYRVRVSQTLLDHLSVLSIVLCP